MTPELFQDLAFRALENPSDAAVWAELDEALQAHPDWRESWMQLAAAYGQAEEILPAHAAAQASAEALDTDIEGAVIPPARLEALRQGMADKKAPAAQATRPGSRWAWVGGMAAALALGWWAWGPSGQATMEDDLMAWRERGPASLQLALVAPLEVVLRDVEIPVQRGTESPWTLRSPLVAATAGPVSIEWTHATNTAVEVTVILLQGEQERWRTTTTEVRVTTPPLPVDEVYALELRVEGGASLREEFVTVEEAGAGESPGDGDLDRILTLATASPARLGEAVLAWWAMPPEVRDSEDGRRVGAWLAVEARQPDLLVAVRK